MKDPHSGTSISGSPILEDPPSMESVITFFGKIPNFLARLGNFWGLGTIRVAPELQEEVCVGWGAEQED